MNTDRSNTTGAGVETKNARRKWYQSLIHLIELQNEHADMNRDYLDMNDEDMITTLDEELYHSITLLLDVLGIVFTSGTPEQEGEFYYIYPSDSADI